jgi:hypothetical protein
MKQHISEECSARSIGCSAIVKGNTMPPRDPDEDEDEEEEEEEDQDDEAPVVREPDED